MSKIQDSPAPAEGGGGALSPAKKTPAEWAQECGHVDAGLRMDPKFGPVLAKGADLQATLPAFMAVGVAAIEDAEGFMQQTMLRLRYASVPVVSAIRSTVNENSSTVGGTWKRHLRGALVSSGLMIWLYS